MGPIPLRSLQIPFLHLSRRRLKVTRLQRLSMSICSRHRLPNMSSLNNVWRTSDGVLRHIPMLREFATVATSFTLVWVLRPARYCSFACDQLTRRRYLQFREPFPRSKTSRKSHALAKNTLHFDLARNMIVSEKRNWLTLNGHPLRTYGTWGEKSELDTKYDKG